MNAPSCPFEESVLQAAKDGAWPALVAAHIVDCSDCADLALVGAIFQATEPHSEAVVDLDRARLIWARADGERRSQRERQALLPVIAAEMAVCFGGAVALISLAVDLGSPFLERSAPLGQRLLADPVVASLAPVTAVLLLGVACVSLVLAVGFRSARS